MAPLPPPPQPTVDLIYRAYEEDAETSPRTHLGASVIGTECERSLWYSFRWATKATHAGRLLRLFETGHMAEARFVANLRRIGVEVLDQDENGRQFRFLDETGHFGGSCDAVALGLPAAPKTWHVVEFKTHSEKSFKALQEKGVQQSKPLHYAQMQVYMKMADLQRAFYLAVNKNTDELYEERVRCDAAFAERLMAKAARIIAADAPPARPYNDRTFYMCRFCAHQDVCWPTPGSSGVPDYEMVAPQRNCRTCMHATPVEDGQWICDRHSWRTPEEQAAGCFDHLFIPALIHGEQVDATADADGMAVGVLYRLADGSTWRDGVPF